MHVPRWIRAQKHKLLVCKVHVFIDASERAYGAVIYPIYLKSMKDNAFTVRLICSKARLAHIKRVILPRLELLETAPRGFVTHQTTALETFTLIAHPFQKSRNATQSSNSKHMGSPP